MKLTNAELNQSLNSMGMYDKFFCFWQYYLKYCRFIFSDRESLEFKYKCSLTARVLFKFNLEELLRLMNDYDLL